MIILVSCKNGNTQEQISAPITNKNNDSTPKSPKFVEADSIIRVKTPIANQLITSPLQITGKARGSWFFEGSAPVKLMNQNNDVMAEGIITAQSDWMTKDFVDFKGELSFTPSENSKTGILVFSKSNPSGLPANDKFYKIPLKFSSEK